MAPHPGPEPLTERPAARRGLALALLLLAGALAASLWAGREQLGSHLAWWASGADARIALRYPALSSALDEAGLRRHFAGLPLQCGDAPAGRLCEATLARADGVPAARLQLRLQSGQLQSTEVSVPWWAHHRAVRALVDQLGAPTAYDRTASDPGPPRSMAWELPRGTLRVALEPGWNPWRWSVLRWSAAGAP